MNSTYRNAVADYGAGLITHIGLVDDNGDELAGGSPAYARKAVTWTSASNGIVRPDGNLVFDIPSGATVAGWRGYSDASAGTDFGGADLAEEVFGSQGTYTLVAASTGIDHQDA